MRSRPQILTWLCTGSFISGSAWIIMLLALILYSLAGEIPTGLFPGLSVEYVMAGYVFIAVQILLALLALIGVIIMWNLKKAGFYLYSLMKVTIYFMPVLFIGSSHLTFPGLILTSVIIIMYGIIFTQTVVK